MKLPSAKLSSLGQYYITWHYGQAYKDIYEIWMNFVWFVFYFFSIGVLMNTLFEPWKRMGEEYPVGFSPGLALQSFVINTLMRIVGVCIRLMVIGIGLTLASIIFVLGLSVLLLWTVMPAFLVALVVIGLTLILFG
jgi:hypothetical protein